MIENKINVLEFLSKHMKKHNGSVKFTKYIDLEKGREKMTEESYEWKEIALERKRLYNDLNSLFKDYRDKVSKNYIEKEEDLSDEFIKGIDHLCERVFEEDLSLKSAVDMTISHILSMLDGNSIFFNGSILNLLDEECLAAKYADRDCNV